MRVLVCGSRDYPNMARVATCLAHLPHESVVMHGTARGVDQYAAGFAEGLGHEVEHYPADWKRYGKRAGIVRNLDMLDARPDLVIAFWDGKSRGTKHTIDEAIRRGIPVNVVAPFGEWSASGSVAQTGSIAFSGSEGTDRA